MDVDALKALVGGLPDLVFRLDESGRYTHFAGGGAPYLPTEDFVGRTMAEVLPAEVATAAERAVRACLATGEVRHLDYTLGEQHFHCRIVRCPGGVVAMATDVTASREVEEQLRHAMRLEAVGRLAGGVSHDLNNMLTCILAVTAAARLDAEDPQLKEDLEAIQDAARSASDLIARLLAFSRRRHVRPRVIEVGEATSNLLRMMQRMVGETHVVELVCTCSQDLHVRMDTSAFEQVLMNLAVNARDAMPEGGTLTVTCGRVEDRVHVVVRDEGIGMDAATLARAVEPFFTTKPEGAGSGLGLSSCYGLVTQAGGTFDIASTPGQGTIVTIALPLVESGVEIEQPAPRVPAAARILVVDDNSFVRDSVHRMLTRLDFDVQVAESVDEAEVLLEESSFDAALVDVVMPGRSGVCLLPALRERGVRVSMMSGYIAQDVRVDLEPGETFLGKPFTLDELAAALDAGT